MWDSYVYVYVHTCTCVYERQKEKEKQESGAKVEKEITKTCSDVCLFFYLKKFNYGLGKRIKELDFANRNPRINSWQI